MTNIKEKFKTMPMPVLAGGIWLFLIFLLFAVCYPIATLGGLASFVTLMSIALVCEHFIG